MYAYLYTIHTIYVKHPLHSRYRDKSLEIGTISKFIVKRETNKLSSCSKTKANPKTLELSPRPQNKPPSRNFLMSWLCSPASSTMPNFTEIMDEVLRSTLRPRAGVADTDSSRFRQPWSLSVSCRGFVNISTKPIIGWLASSLVLSVSRRVYRKPT